MAPARKHFKARKPSWRVFHPLEILTLQPQIAAMFPCSYFANESVSIEVFIGEVLRTSGGTWMPSLLGLNAQFLPRVDKIAA